MTNVNFCLMTLAFVLGLVLTFASMIRRGQPEVPDARPHDGER